MNKAAIALIKAIAADDGGSWAKITINVDEVKKQAKDLITSIKNADGYKQGTRDLRRERKEYFACQKRLSEQYEKNDQQRDENLIIELENMKKVLSNNLENISTTTGVGLSNRRIKGLKEFINLIGDKKGEFDF